MKMPGAEEDRKCNRGGIDGCCHQLWGSGDAGNAEKGGSRGRMTFAHDRKVAERERGIDRDALIWGGVSGDADRSVGR
jgi:hypothetical protein